MRLASPGASVKLGACGIGWRERGGICTPAGRFAHTCGAGSAEHRVCAGGCVGAQGGKAVYLASGCLCACVRVCVCGLCKPV